MVADTERPLFKISGSSPLHCFLFHVLHNEKKKSQIFAVIFWSHGNFFDILLVFVSFLQIHYGVCFFHILSFYFCLLQINFSIYLLLALLTFFYHFHKNPSLCLVSRLGFFDNNLCYSFFIYNKKKI